jgi:hypothetical protein
MPVKNLDRNNLQQGEDWEGNNIALSCPVCAKVYLVSAILHRAGRPCPRCQKSTGFVDKGKDSGGSARIEWQAP